MARDHNWNISPDYRIETHRKGLSARLVVLAKTLVRPLVRLYTDQPLSRQAQINQYLLHLCHHLARGRGAPAAREHVAQEPLRRGSRRRGVRGGEPRALKLAFVVPRYGPEVGGGAAGRSRDLGPATGAPGPLPWRS